MPVTTTVRKYGNFAKVTFACTTDADGNATGATLTRFTGAVVRCVFAPGVSGDQPTNAFDVTVLDGDSYDILAGQGADISNSAVTTKVDSMGAVVNDLLTVVLANGGNAKKVTVHVYIQSC